MTSLRVSGFGLGACALTLFCAADSARATTVTLTAIDAGFVTMAGGSAKGDGTVSPADYNYSVGREEHFIDGALFSPLVYMDRKNYFVFDLSSVTGPITSATLEVYMGPGVAPPFPGGTHGYESLDATETFELFETTDPGSALTAIDALEDIAGTVGSAGFDEVSDPGVTIGAGLYPVLGDGPLLLGGTITSPADDGTSLIIPITPGGLGYLDLFAGSSLVLAGSLTTATDPSPSPDVDSQLIFGFTGPDIPGGDPLTPTLEITFVPEPTSMVLLGLGGLLLMKRRR